MTDLQAAIGREQLKRLPDIVATRRRLARRYRELLGGIPGLAAPVEPAWARSNWQSYCVGCRRPPTQRTVMQALLDRGISTRRGVMNIHLEPAYAGPDAFRRASSLGRSVAAQTGSIILPLYAQMTDEELACVVDALDDVLAHHEILGGLEASTRPVRPEFFVKSSGLLLQPQNGRRLLTVPIGELFSNSCHSTPLKVTPFGPQAL